MPLTKSTPTSTYVKDFVHSKNKKFKGKDKAERIRSALGASYGKKDEAVAANSNVPGGIKIVKVANDNKRNSIPKPTKEELELAIEQKISKHAIAVKSHKGKNVGHGGFNKVEKAAAKEYGSKEAGEKVASSIMWKKYVKK